MSLAPAIEFNDLVAQLTTDETKRFINEFTVSHPQIVFQLLSTRFINQSRSDIGDLLNVLCNESLSNIIRSRDTDSNTPDVSHDVTTFDTLPRRLIGYCGSFLDQKSYGRLSLCNRSSYLGTNTPIMLRELTVHRPTGLEHDVPTDLSLFPMANKLVLDYSICRLIGDFRPTQVQRTHIIATQIAAMPRLNSLDLISLDHDRELFEIIANINQNVQTVSLIYLSASSVTLFKNF